MEINSGVPGKEDDDDARPETRVSVVGWERVSTCAEVGLRIPTLGCAELPDREPKVFVPAPSQ